MQKFVLLLLLPLLHAASIPFTIGNTISQGKMIQGAETTLFEYTGTGTLTYFWMTGGWKKINETILTIELDDDKFSFPYYAGLGIGFGDERPWGIADVGKGGKTGAVYNTFRIPFARGVKVTALIPDHVPKDNFSFFSTVRGVSGVLPIMVGEVELPLGKTYLKLYAKENVIVTPLAFHTLFNTTRCGAIYQTVLIVNSASGSFFEGCFRSHQPANNPEFTLVSSGMEDYFQSSYYFGGVTSGFWYPGAGATHLAYAPGNNFVSAYKFHTRDLYIFERGMAFTWRNGDTVDHKTNEKCVNIHGRPNGSPKNATVSTFVWVYEWDC